MEKNFDKLYDENNCFKIIYFCPEGDGEACVGPKNCGRFDSCMEYKEIKNKDKE